MRALSPLDRLLAEIDQSLRTVHAEPPTTERANPAKDYSNTQPLSEAERKLAAGLMRVNHAGEISAQGLYRGQALTARLPEVREQMERAAAEENDHLAWCEKRLNELNSRKSFLKPLWYWGSFTIGALAGKAGDRWSLGFVKETEDQVEKHLDDHLRRLPSTDVESRVILEQMREDEQHHAHVAQQAGAATLPLPIRKVLMPLLSKVMTSASFRF